MLDQKLLETAILTIRDASVRWGWGGFHYRVGTAVRKPEQDSDGLPATKTRKNQESVD